MVREPHALHRQAVEVWGRYLFLPIGTQFAVTQVVGEDEDNVEFGRRRAARCGVKPGASQRQHCSHGAGRKSPGCEEQRGSHTGVREAQTEPWIQVRFSTCATAHWTGGELLPPSD